MKTLVALDESLLRVIQRALLKHQQGDDIALVVEAARQVQVALDLLAAAKEAAPK